MSLSNERLRFDAPMRVVRELYFPLSHIPAVFSTHPHARLLERLENQAGSDLEEVDVDADVVVIGGGPHPGCHTAPADDNDGNDDDDDRINA